MKRIRILLIEDNRILRDGITTIINAQTDMRVVEATGGASYTLQMTRRLSPDMLLMDLGLRSQSGVRLVRSLTRELPDVKVIGMGLIPSQSDVVEFVAAGAAGFILKDATRTDFLKTIRSVAKGAKIIPPLLADSLFSLVVDHAFKKGKDIPAEVVRMTMREREIVSLIADGLSNKDIAKHLNVATHTVKSHVHNILEKLALHSRLQISAYMHNEVGS